MGLWLRDQLDIGVRGATVDRYGPWLRDQLDIGVRGATVDRYGALAKRSARYRGLGCDSR